MQISLARSEASITFIFLWIYICLISKFLYIIHTYVYFSLGYHTYNYPYLSFYPFIYLSTSIYRYLSVYPSSRRLGTLACSSDEDPYSIAGSGSSGSSGNGNTRHRYDSCGSSNANTGHSSNRAKKRQGIRASTERQ